jgi:hypothetical protein
MKNLFIKMPNEVEGTVSAWIFTIVGWASELLPLVQFISFMLAIVVSLITFYRMMKNGKSKSN